MSTDPSNIAVALLYETHELGEQLRGTLCALGTPIVYEAATGALDREALERSHATVVVVNLDAQNDPDLDGVYDLLDDSRYRVVFNDGDVSRGLSGWDHARWLRHLSAKILGDADIDPPRPVGAEAVPAPPAGRSQPQAPQGQAVEAGTDAGIAGADIVRIEPARSEPRVEPAVAHGAAAPESAIAAVAASGSGFDLIDSIDLDALIDAANTFPTLPSAPAPGPAAGDAGAHAAQPETGDAAGAPGLDEFGLDFDLDAPLAGEAPPALAAGDGTGVDFDFDFDSAAAEPRATATPSFAPRNDFTDEFERDADTALERAADSPAADGMHESTPDQGASAPDATSAAIDFTGELELDTDFDSEPVVGESMAEDLHAPSLDRDAAEMDPTDSGIDFSNEFELGGEFDLERAADDAVPAAAPSMPASAGAAAVPEWSLEEMLEDLAGPPVVPAAAPAQPADFGIEKLRAEEFLAPPVDDSPAQPFHAPTGPALELIPLEEAVAPTAVEAVRHENWLDPEAAQPKVRKVWVLGASIGGPEAVRGFLAALPRDYPALFLLAQHLGDEFVEMMIRQLAQATPMTVRAPTHGERVGHGEIVVVPTSQRLRVDAQGVVVLERNTEETAFSPSIDRVLRDVADRFGANAGAIIFSGMTDDAVEGCRYLAAKGGTVYAQDPDTCVVSTMIDGVRDAGVVSFLGSPQELAEKLAAG